MQKINMAYEITDTIYIILKTLAIVMVINIFFIGFARVNGDSMYPTLHSGDLVMLNKFDRNYDYGDIVVTDSNNSMGKSIIKRIVGLPGDIIYIDDKGIQVNGKEYSEFDTGLDIENPGNREYPYKVPEGRVFLVGDNRFNSTDSRYLEVGAIPIEDIHGKYITTVLSYRLAIEK